MSAAVSLRSHVCARAGVGRNGQLPAQGRAQAVVSGMPGSGVRPDLRARDSCRAAASPVLRPSGFEQVILPHLDAAYNLALWLMRDPSDAEDVVQDACLRALQYFASCRCDSAKAWLLQIVRNTAYTTLRSPRRRIEVALESGEDGIGMNIADPDPGPEAITETAQDLTQLKAAVEALPVDLRECLILREMEEFSYKEIARITDLPIGTVMSRLHRARCQLMASWTDGAWRQEAVSSP